MDVLIEPVATRSTVEKAQLSLGLACNRAGKTVLRDRYMAYPLSVSPVFRLEADGSGQASHLEQRAYLYRMNTSPGLLAGDTLGMAVRLAAGSSLYLADQAATKVHSMPADRTARVNYGIEVGDRATLEFLPEPLILFADAQLKQTTEITLSPTAGLSWGEIILPGRLARGEAYQFRECWSTLKIRSPDGPVWFVETMRLLGKDNRFSQGPLFAGPSASQATMGTLILGLPNGVASREHLNLLSRDIDGLSTASLTIASSVLPGDRGLFVRAIAQTTREMQAGFKAAVNRVRTLRQQAPLPYSI